MQQGDIKYLQTDSKKNQKVTLKMKNVVTDRKKKFSLEENSLITYYLRNNQCAAREYWRIHTEVTIENTKSVRVQEHLLPTKIK